MVNIGELTSVTDIVRALPFISDNFTQDVLLVKQYGNSPPILLEREEIAQPTPAGDKATLHMQATSSPATSYTNFLPLVDLAAFLSSQSLKQFERVERYWVSQKSESLFPEEEPDMQPYQEKIHEVYDVEEITFNTEEQKRNRYVPVDSPEEEIETQPEEHAISFKSHDFLLSEALSWKGHLFKDPFALERFHQLSTALLPFVFPIRFDKSL